MTREQHSLRRLIGIGQYAHHQIHGFCDDFSDGIVNRCEINVRPLRHFHIVET